jgi:AcrR family transcriptional regulator
MRVQVRDRHRTAVLPGPSIKERQRQLREDAILDAATDLIRAKGFNGMSLESIAEAIGVSRPTVYQHFSSKEDVAAHIVIRNLKEVEANLASLDPSDTPGQRLRSFVRKALELRFDRSHLAMYDLTRIRLSHGNDSPELIEAESRFLSGVTRLIVEAQESGEAWSGVPAHLFQLALVGFIKNPDLDLFIEQGRTTPADIEEALLSLLFGARQPELTLCGSAESQNPGSLVNPFSH